MSREKKAGITDCNYDIVDCCSGRLMRLALLYRIMPGRCRPGAGPAAVDAVRMFVWHRLGKIMCKLAVRFEKQATAFVLWRSRVLQGKK